MEWLGNGASHPDKEFNPTSSGFSSACPHQQQPASHPCLSALCQNQQRCVKASILSSWRLAEAQDQLCSLEVHSSESVEQEHARTLTCPTELTHTLEEWRRKESMLGGQEPNRSLVLGAVGSWDVFDRSIINVQKQPVEMDQDKCKSFQQKYEQELRYFGMLRRWDDSQRFLADTPQLICEETANYLILWCMRLQQEGKEALMDQVAHQAVVMQFILEMASNSQQDPRGCFRHFFHKAKEGQDVYLEVFHTELEAFKHRVKEYSVTCRSNTANVEEQNSGTYCRPDPKESTDYFSPVADFTAKRHFNAGLWTNSGWLTKDDTTETDDMRMMETS
ncbi:hsp90 co-chaperone Cdc37-like 1 isoform X2 [Gouania willdenowi]|uniref:hsp90 co-chaperone Cdc37-like 1 isoform X2 n=1 Tax=Gouania willdenowi TaxID=441366 RepID=UPI0010553DD3|nr:hsp90 co-chaperone Cdc37-like 1 isoform X2 [Gouania willdenowi]